MNYKPILSDPTEYNEPEEEKCALCDNDLTHEETTEQDNDAKFCDNCFYSCCGDELDQDNRRCKTCGEHN